MTKYILIFNKITGAFAGQLGYSKDAVARIDHSLVNHKVVEMVEGEKWEGTFEEGSIVKESQEVVVYETEMNILAGSKIESEYPVYKQLNIMMGLLDKLAKDDGSDEYSDFKNMLEYISKTRANNQRYIESSKMAEDRKFISIEDQKKAIGEVLEGPMRSIIGRPGGL